MRQALSLVLVLLMVTHSGPTVFGADNVTSQIAAMATGTNIEVHLKNKQTVSGARGEVSSSGFTLVDPQTGDHRLAFNDVSSVKELNKKSHVTRNVLTGVGIVVAIVVVAAVAVVISLKHQKY